MYYIFICAVYIYYKIKKKKYPNSATMLCTHTHTTLYTHLIIRIGIRTSPYYNRHYDNTITNSSSTIQLFGGEVPTYLYIKRINNKKKKKYSHCAQSKKIKR